MRINLAPHLADQLALNETRLLIHMVAQTDMAAAQRAVSLLTGLQYKFNCLLLRMCLE